MNPNHIATQFTIKAASVLRGRWRAGHSKDDHPDASDHRASPNLGETLNLGDALDPGAACGDRTTWCNVSLLGGDAPALVPTSAQALGPSLQAKGHSSRWSQLGHDAAHQITLRVVDRLADHAAAAVDRALTPEPSAAARARALWRTSSKARAVLGAALDASGSPAAQGAAKVLRVVGPMIDELSGR